MACPSEDPVSFMPFKSLNSGLGKPLIKMVSTGLYLVPPHGRLIWEGKKSAIVKSVKFDSHIGEPLYLIEDGLVWGVITLEPPVEIKPNDLKELYPKTRITLKQAEEWGFLDKDKLYLYGFKFERFDKPKKVEVPQGVQTFVNVENLKIEELSLADCVVLRARAKLERSSLLWLLSEEAIGSMGGVARELVKNLEEYDPKKLDTDVLKDDFRILLGLLSNLERGFKFKWSRELMMGKLREIIVELKKRGIRFHPETMKPMARRLFLEASEGLELVKVKNVEEIDAQLVEKLPDRELLKLHEWLHEEFKKQGGKVTEPFFNAHIFIHEEMFARGLEHPDQPQDALDEKAMFIVEEYPTPKGHSKEAKPVLALDLWNRFPNSIPLGKNFVYLVGGTVNRGYSIDQDFDVLILQDEPDEQIMSALFRALPKDLGERLHFIFSSKPLKIGRKVPLYQLALVKAEGYKELSAEGVKLWQAFKPMKAKAGPGKTEFFTQEDAWKNWASQMLEKGETIIVQPKCDGMRFILEKEGDKIGFFTEDEFRNRAEVLKNSAEEFRRKCRAKEVILDAEAILFKPKEGLETKNIEEALEPLPREDMIKLVGAKEVDDSTLIFYVHDCLFLNGEDLTQKPYVERLKKLEEAMDWKNCIHFKYMPTFYVKSLKEYNEAMKKAAFHKVSEGAMLKTASSKYYPNKRIPEWAKYKATKEISVMVWRRLPNVEKKTGKIVAWRFEAVYRLTDDDLKAENWDRQILVKWKGKTYAIIGLTYAFDKPLERGTIIDVRTIRIRRYETKDGVRYTWMFPIIKGVRKDLDEPDYFETVKRIAEAGVKPLSEEAVVVRLKQCPYGEEDWCPLKEFFTKPLLSKAKAYLETPRHPMPCRIAYLYRCKYLDQWEYYGFKPVEVKNNEH